MPIIMDELSKKLPSADWLSRSARWVCRCSLMAAASSSSVTVETPRKDHMKRSPCSTVALRKGP
jgi:hypothetical protein